jgi:hypothetical protein
MRFRDFLLAEEKNDTAVMTFGRFQPITSAHETLIKQVGSLAKEKGAHPFVFTSRKSGDKKNPLDFNMKSDMLRKHYGVNVPDSEEINNPFQAAQHLGKLGYKNVHLVLGGDRVKDIGGMIKKYMGHEDPEKRINISNLTLHSAGERSANPVSGTAVRAAARSGNVKEFQRMIAPSLGKESTETIYRVLRGEQQLGEGIRQAFSYEDPDERDRRKQTEQEKQDFEDFKKKQNPDKIEGESLRDLLRKAGVKKPVSKRTGLGSTKLVGVKDPKTGKIVIKQVFANESLGEEANPRIPRKKGQPAKSKKHSDLYTDEDPKGTIHGLGFKNASVARASVKKIESSSRSHAHKIQAAVAMEQRARVANKDAAAAIYRRYIDRNKKSD